MTLMAVLFLFGIILPLIQAWKSFVKMKHSDASNRNKICYEYDFNVMCLIASIMGVGLIITSAPLFLIFISK